MNYKRKTIPYDREVHKMFQTQKKKFKTQFGRDPEPDDPLLFDETQDAPAFLAPDQIHKRTLVKMKSDKLRTSILYAYEKYGLLPPPTEAALDKYPEMGIVWRKACDEWEELEASGDYQKFTHFLELTATEKERDDLYPSTLVERLTVQMDSIKCKALLERTGVGHPDDWAAVLATNVSHVENLKLMASRTFRQGFYPDPAPQETLDISVSSNRDNYDWNWDKNLSVWKPEWIDLLANVILGGYRGKNIVFGEKGDTHDFSWKWSTRDVDPVVWKTHPFITACKAMRFFTQYPLGEEELGAVFPARQLWFFDTGCVEPLSEIFDTHLEDQEGHRISEVNLATFLHVIAVSRVRENGKFKIKADFMGFNIWQIHEEMFSLYSGIPLDSTQGLVHGVTAYPTWIDENTVPDHQSKIWLASLIDFMQQKITLQIKKGIHSKKVKKRLEKKLGYVPEYTVMSLRTVEADEGAKEGAVGRKLMYRQLVREHYKNVRVGPQGRRRKLILVDAYERGPEDAPLIPTKKSKRIIR
jgi:hypothetical protein